MLDLSKVEAGVKEKCIMVKRYGIGPCKGRKNFEFSLFPILFSKAVFLRVFKTYKSLCER